MDQDLTPYDQALLNHLDREISIFENKDLEAGYPRDTSVKQNLDRSRREKKQCIDRLRKQGKRI